MPINLVKFSLLRYKNSIALSWLTATETDNAYFAIERSPDAVQYTEIARLPGQGTSAAEHQYAYTDERPLPGTNYYRLRQVDYDGTFSYSPVEAVTMPRAPGATVFPAPADAYVTLRLPEASGEPVAWELCDAQGRTVARGAVPPQETEATIRLEDRAPGVYWLRVQGEALQVLKQ